MMMIGEHAVVAGEIDRVAHLPVPFAEVEDAEQAGAFPIERSERIGA
jgi:hypothetical protein